MRIRPGLDCAHRQHLRPPDRCHRPRPASWRCPATLPANPAGDRLGTRCPPRPGRSVTQCGARQDGARTPTRRRRRAWLTGDRTVHPGEMGAAVGGSLAVLARGPAGRRPAGGRTPRPRAVGPGCPTPARSGTRPEERRDLSGLPAEAAAEWRCRSRPGPAGRAAVSAAVRRSLRDLPAPPEIAGIVGGGRRQLRGLRDHRPAARRAAGPACTSRPAGRGIRDLSPETGWRPGSPATGSARLGGQDGVPAWTKGTAALLPPRGAGDCRRGAGHAADRVGAVRAGSGRPGPGGGASATGEGVALGGRDGGDRWQHGRGRACRRASTRRRPSLRRLPARRPRTRPLEAVPGALLAWDQVAGECFRRRATPCAAVRPTTASGGGTTLLRASAHMVRSATLARLGWIRREGCCGHRRVTRYLGGAGGGVLRAGYKVYGTRGGLWIICPGTVPGRDPRGVLGPNWAGKSSSSTCRPHCPGRADGAGPAAWLRSVHQRQVRRDLCYAPVGPPDARGDRAGDGLCWANDDASAAVVCGSRRPKLGLASTRSPIVWLDKLSGGRRRSPGSPWPSWASAT